MEAESHSSTSENASAMEGSARPRIPTRRLTSVASFLERYGVYVALVVVLLIAALIAPAFYKPLNLYNVIRQSAALGVASVGQTFVVLGAGIDLSVGAVMGLAVVLIADISGGNDSLVPLATLITLMAAALVGLLNGFLVTKRNVPPIVATLGVGILVEGARLAYTRATPSGGVPPIIRFFGKGQVGPIPTAIIVLAVFAGLGGFVLHRTSYGRKLYAAGGNREAARLSGIPVDRILVVSYVICSVLAGVAGLLVGGYIGYVDRYLGRGFELDSIAAVIVGGAAFMGGRGNLRGTIAGVLFLTILLNIVLILNLNVQLQLVVKGLAIIGAVALYSALRRD